MGPDGTAEAVPYPKPSTRPGLVSRALAFSARAPERTQTEPTKRHRAGNCNRKSAGPHPSGVIFPVFLHGGAGKAECHDEENDSDHFQPQLVGCARERSHDRASTCHQRAERAAAACLLPRNTRRRAQLLERRNFAHGLDFNSLWRYNDATSGDGARGKQAAPFTRRPHLK
jgi:hypothetical protein